MVGEVVTRSTCRALGTSSQPRLSREHFPTGGTLRRCSAVDCSIMHGPTTSSLHPPSLPHTFTLSVCAVVACPCAESGVTPGCRKLHMACTPSSSRARRSLLLATRIREGAPPPETPDLDCFLQPTSHHCHPHPAAAASNMFDPSLNRTLVAFAHTV